MPSKRPLGNCGTQLVPPRPRSKSTGLVYSLVGQLSSSQWAFISEYTLLLIPFPFYKQLGNSKKKNKHRRNSHKHSECGNNHLLGPPEMASVRCRMWQRHASKPDGANRKRASELGTAAAMSQEAQGRGKGKTLPCAYRELVVELVGEQRVRELPEVHFAEGAHAVSVADSQLRNLLTLKFMAGEKDTKMVEEEESK